MLAEPMPRYRPAYGNVSQRSTLCTAYSRNRLPAIAKGDILITKAFHALEPGRPHFPCH
jgi:hypothetical protein